MLVKYRNVGGVGDYALLFDETQGDVLESDRGSCSILMQQEPLAAGTSQFRATRGNTAGKVSLKWSSVYASLNAARAAIISLNSIKLNKVHLQFTEDNVNYQYLPNAVITSYEWDRQGVSVTHTMNFEGDDLTMSTPS